MITVNKKLMTQVQHYLNRNNRIKAIDLLCANKCDLDVASDIVNKLAKSDAYIDQYVIDRIQRLLPNQKLAGAKTISEYYEIRLPYAKRLIDAIVRRKDYSNENIKKVLDQLNPTHRKDDKETQQDASGYYQSKLFQFLANGREEEGIDLIMQVLKMDTEEASEYLDDFRSNLTRDD